MQIGYIVTLEKYLSTFCQLSPCLCVRLHDDDDDVDEELHAMHHTLKPQKILYIYLLSHVNTLLSLHLKWKSL